jgi:hypothetical protein
MLYVTGGSDLTGFLNVSGASVLHEGVTTGMLYVTGGSDLTGFLNVSGASVLHEGVTTGMLYVTGGSDLTGFLNVSGASVLHTGVTTGMLYVTGGSDLTGFLNVSGASVLHEGVTTGMLYVTGGSDLTGFLNVSGGSFFQDDLTVTTANVIISTNDFTPILNDTSASGGSILFNTVDVSPSLGDISREREFQAANAVVSPTAITGFLFSNSVVRAFDAIVSVTIYAGITAETSLFAYYNLKGIQKAGNWVLNSSFVGDVTGFTFSIDNSGQIQYTSTSVGNYIESRVNFRALTTTIYQLP